MADQFYSWDKGNLRLELQIQAGSSKDSIAGEHNNRLKISIAKAPEAGKANQHLIKFLAKHLGVKQKQVTIISGQKSKFKSILISGLNPQHPCTQAYNLLRKF